MKKKLDKKKMVEKLKKSPAYKIAYHDDDFMDIDYLRPTRLQLELLKPEIILRHEKVYSTIVVFGGTRIMEPKDAKAKVLNLERRLAKKSGDSKLKKQL